MGKENFNEEAMRVIDYLGGPTVISKELDTSPQRITNWKRIGIPKFANMYLKLAYPKAYKKK